MEPAAASHDPSEPYDLLIIGGGVNGAGIARDAAGRGFSVVLAEAGDFGGGTSSASSKLLHGGLRYLEYFEIRLVREALAERELLLRAMPHISRPMRFVMPYDPAMRFEGTTPVSRLLSVVMPWMKGRRPPWMIRLGLFLYDHIGGRSMLPGTRTLDLQRDEAGRCLKDKFLKAYEYSDGWVDDSRLVVLNLIDAQRRGARVMRSTSVAEARYEGGLWTARLSSENGTEQVRARMVVNAAGPWVDHVLAQVFGLNEAQNVRLVRGSHIVVRRKFDHDRPYIFQNPDTRIIFAIPFQGDYTIIGTTDVDHPSPDVKPEISDAETDYLSRTASAYFTEEVRREDIVWTYSGVRPLYFEGEGSAQAATRDYVLKRDPGAGEGTLINIFGGKITTFRRLSESALELIEETLGSRGASWTAKAPMPGGDFEGGPDTLAARIGKAHPYLPDGLAGRLARTYGTIALEILDGCTSLADLGEDLASGLFAAEVRHLMRHEWAREARDVAFRRTKLGIGMTEAQLARLGEWMAAELAAV